MVVYVSCVVDGSSRLAWMKACRIGEQLRLCACVVADLLEEQLCSKAY